MVRFRYGRARRTRGGFSARLLVAAVIACFSLVSYYRMGQVNPVTGERQRVGMDEGQEIQMGLAAVAQMKRQHGGDHPDPRLRAQVDTVGRKLVRALEDSLAQQRRDHPYTFQFHLLRDDQTLNAFALPGGQVFITHALFSRLTTEGQLAGVLGHEIAHVILRHGAQRMAKQRLTQGLAGAAGVAGGTADTAQMAQAVGQLVNMRYGRRDELESDRWGVRLAHSAGYDPRAMLGVMEILDEASGGRQTPEMLSTHPKPANRQAYLRQLIRREFPEGLSSELTP